MRTKLVLTRHDTRAAREDQVISSAIDIELSQSVKELYEALEKEPEKHELYIQLSNELAKHALYRQAAEVLSTYLISHPFDSEALCLRGRKYMAIQRFEDSAADLEMAARLEPDNWPVLYHLGLVQYIRGNFQRAAFVLRHCFEVSNDGGSQVAAAVWYWASLTRTGRRDEADKLAASIDENIDYGENYSYYKAMMFYKGVLTREETLKVDEDDIPDITLAVNCYNVANLLLSDGDTEGAYSLMKQAINAAGDNMWSAFSYLASTEDLRRAGLLGESE